MILLHFLSSGELNKTGLKSIKSFPQRAQCSFKTLQASHVTHTDPTRKMVLQPSSLEEEWKDYVLGLGSDIPLLALR